MAEFIQPTVWIIGKTNELYLLKENLNRSRDNYYIELKQEAREAVKDICAVCL